MKTSRKSDDDFHFFSTSDLCWLGGGIGQASAFDENGFSARECWFSLDTRGKRLPCREPDLLDKAFAAKKSWNAQIKQWAESIAEETLFQWELVDYCHGLPEWIFDATMGQAKKLAIARKGWLPTFMELWRVKNQWFPPWMREFDPMI